MALTTTTLAAACGVNDTTIRVTSATGFVPQQLIRIDDEILAQSSAGSSGTAISVRRGLEGTIPAAHANRAVVQSGTGADFAAPPLGEVAVATSPNLLRQQVTTIPHAQILTLPTQGVTIVPAAGPNRVLYPITILCQVTIITGYTVTGDPSWTVRLAGSDWQVSCPAPISLTGNNTQRLLAILHPWMEPGSFAFAGQISSQYLVPIYQGHGVNQALELVDSYASVPDYTGGHASNTLTVTTSYFIYDIVRKAFV